VGDERCRWFGCGESEGEGGWLGRSSAKGWCCTRSGLRSGPPRGLGLVIAVLGASLAEMDGAGAESFVMSDAGSADMARAGGPSAAAAAAAEEVAMPDEEEVMLTAAGHTVSCGEEVERADANSLDESDKASDVVAVAGKDVGCGHREVC